MNAILSYARWKKLYDDFVTMPEAERGLLTGVGVRDEARLRRAYDRYVTATQAYYDPLRIAAEIMKIIVGETYRGGRDGITFEDGNRRMALVYAQRILAIGEKDLKLTPKEGLEIKENVRFWTTDKLEAYLSSRVVRANPYAIAFKTTESRLNSSAETVSNQASNSSSVIEGNNGSPDIRMLRQSTLGGKGIDRIVGRQKVQLYDWQRDLPAKWKAQGCKGTIKAVPGSGKTIAALTIMAEVAGRMDVVVPTLTLKAQWEGEIRARHPGMAGRVHVWVINTAARSAIDTDLLVVDEAHRSTSPIYSQLYANWKYRCVLGMTATPTPESIAYTGPVVADIGFKEARLSPFKVIFHLVPLSVPERSEYDILTRRILRLKQKSDEDIPEARREDAVKMLVMQRRSLVYEIKSRVPATVKIVMQSPRSKTLILTERIGQADEIYRSLTDAGARAVLYHSHHGREYDIEAFKRGRVPVMVSVRQLKEGFDVPDIEREIIASTALTEQHHIQALGRAIRYYPGKRAEIHILLADDTTDLNVLAYRDKYEHEVRRGDYVLAESEIPAGTVYDGDPWWSADKYTMDSQGVVFKAGARGKVYYGFNEEFERALETLRRQGVERFGRLGKSIFYQVRTVAGPETREIRLEQPPQVRIKGADVRAPELTQLGAYEKPEDEGGMKYEY